MSSSRSWVTRGFRRGKCCYSLGCRHKNTQKSIQKPHPFSCPMSSRSLVFSLPFLCAFFGTPPSEAVLRSGLCVGRSPSFPVFRVTQESNGTAAIWDDANESPERDAKRKLERERGEEERIDSKRHATSNRQALSSVVLAVPSLPSHLLFAVQSFGLASSTLFTPSVSPSPWAPLAFSFLSTFFLRLLFRCV